VCVRENPLFEPGRRRDITAQGSVPDRVGSDLALQRKGLKSSVGRLHGTLGQPVQPMVWLKTGDRGVHRVALNRAKHLLTYWHGVVHGILCRHVCGVEGGILRDKA
jgi:hypothetical protein